MRPIQHKMEEIQDFLSIANHPNFGGINYLSPTYLMDMLKEKKQKLFPSAYSSIYGVNKHKQEDYPFAYRSNEAANEKT